MSELKDNLTQILQEKQEKIIPENIKKDVQIFNITGTYEGEDSVNNYINLQPAEESVQFINLITKIPVINTSNVTDMSSMFSNYLNLEEVPSLDTNKATNISDMFVGCTKLSNESLNNILQMCINAVSYTGNKTLKTIGLSEEQATKCTILSNYSAFTAAGWKTGYTSIDDATEVSL